MPIMLTEYFLSFKTSVTSHRTAVSVWKQLSSGITLFFARHCPMSSANVQACCHL